MSSDITIDNILNKLINKDESDINKILLAYNFASRFHKNQYRDSGDKYIIHPLNVAYIVLNLYDDTNLIAASLLHDALEDTNLIKEDIEFFFNKDIAFLVDGVTKISKDCFYKKEDEIYINKIKLINYGLLDERVFILKLADRLHNMRTLKYKVREKQLENAYETLYFYVVLAEKLGLYEISKELNDLSNFYINDNKEKIYIKK